MRELITTKLIRPLSRYYVNSLCVMSSCRATSMIAPSQM